MFVHLDPSDRKMFSSLEGSCLNTWTPTRGVTLGSEGHLAGNRCEPLGVRFEGDNHFWLELPLPVTYQAVRSYTGSSLKPSMEINPSSLKWLLLGILLQKQEKKSTLFLTFNLIVLLLQGLSGYCFSFEITISIIETQIKSDG